MINNINKKTTAGTLLMVLSFVVIPKTIYAEALNNKLNEYQQATTEKLSSENGKALWSMVYTNNKTGDKRSCTTCHMEDLTLNGKHQRTGKLIKPMAPSVNPERYNKERKIAKWFKRNCKWTMGRECTAKEKGDILLYLSNQ